MAQAYCTVCRVDLDEPKKFQGRTYCETHFDLFSRNFPSFWRATSLAIVALIGEIIAIATLAVLLPGPLPQPIQVGAGVTLAIVPGLVWLTTFFVSANQDESYRISPLLITVFFIGGLVAAAFARPLLFQFLGVNEWLAATSANNRFIGNILLMGTTHTLIIFTVVRFTVWYTPTFTRRMDGMTYGLMAGWGYAMVWTSLAIFERGGMTMLNGGLRIVTELCPYIALSMTIGYFLGRARFEETAFYYLGLGLITAAAGSGILLYAGTELNNIRLNLTTDGFSPWPGIVINMLALVLVTAALYGLQRRHNRITRARVGLED